MQCGIIHLLLIACSICLLQISCVPSEDASTDAISYGLTGLVSNSRAISLKEHHIDHHNAVRDHQAINTKAVPDPKELKSPARDF
jgi:hypothetical protein